MCLHFDTFQRIKLTATGYELNRIHMQHTGQRRDLVPPHVLNQSVFPALNSRLADANFFTDFLKSQTKFFSPIKNFLSDVIHFLYLPVGTSLYMNNFIYATKISKWLDKFRISYYTLSCG